MRLGWLSLLVFVALSAVFASAQSGDCELLVNENGPYRCPNGSSCGVYYTPQFEGCVPGDPCVLFETKSFCCGRYNILLDPADVCLIGELRNPRVTSRILEFAKDNEILVPTCQGAYLPAEIALRSHKGKIDGGL